MKSNRLVPMMALLAVLGCDYVDTRVIDREREDAIYKEAMAEYAAGRMDKAIAGLQRVVRADPANSSARFQLACLLQDVRKDYLGAICQYREFLALDKSGEKKAFAGDRMTQCERALGPELIRRYDIGGGAALLNENQELKEKLAALEKSKADVEKQLEKAKIKADESFRESERMRRMLTGEVAEDALRPVNMTESALLDEDEGASADRIRQSQDVNCLVVDEKEPSAPPFEETEQRKSYGKKAAPEPPHEPRPEEYVVQDGDTLYKLAIRFYGRRSAWTKIREANKAVISTDGRVKTGQKIVLP